MKYLKIIPLLFLSLNISAKQPKEVNCDVIADISMIVMILRQSGLSKTEVNEDIPYKKLTNDEKVMVRNLIETIFKVPVTEENKTYEFSENFMESVRKDCFKQVEQ
ncbi:hypothetical protein [Acinetobacter haemolyticus]|uniref:hypothetical protein n=1 Tax=Acinetobacter haemolyticus TaxID=29430 RepID=UPI00325BFCFD